MMSPAFLLAVLLLTCSQLATSTAVSPGQGSSCEGRCGELFSRGRVCSCDISCLAHDECCKDFETLCTSGESCSGRCGESFKRGRPCECDPDCARFNTCCLDYQNHCDVTTPLPTALQKSLENKNIKPCACLAGLGDAAVSLLEGISTLPSSPVAGSSLPPYTNPQALHSGTDTLMPGQGGPSEVNDVPQDPSSSGGPLHIQVMLSPGGSASSSQAAGASGPRPQPGSLPILAPAPGASGPDTSGPDASSTPDLCDDQPIDGLTVLNNGSILVFKGHFYWLVDPRTRTPGPARNISEDLGLPSPIDTVFTRCNCQGKTYIMKGDQYWGLDNGAVEPGYPKPMSSGFAGLAGDISAALPVPSTRKRPEAVYFFKNGGKMQKFSYPTGSSPTCTRGSKPSSQSSSARQAGHLGLDVNIQVSIRGLPSTITSALSVPNPKKNDGYDYFLFSGPQYFNVKISGDLPSLAKPPSHAVPGATNQPKDSVYNWLKCP